MTPFALVIVPIMQYLAILREEGTKMKAHPFRSMEEATSSAFIKLAKEKAGEPTGYGSKRVYVSILGKFHIIIPAREM